MRGVTGVYIGALLAGAALGGALWFAYATLTYGSIFAFMRPSVRVSFSTFAPDSTVNASPPGDYYKQLV